MRRSVAWNNTSIARIEHRISGHSSHVPMLSQPDVVTELIAKAAASF
jgi:hypothetical protein